MDVTTTTRELLTIDSPEIKAFLHAWHESGRAHFARYYPASYANGAYDKAHAKSAKQGRKWINLDEGDEVSMAGKYMVDRATHEVFGIKAYGVPHRNHYHGTIEELTAKFGAQERQDR